METTTWDIAIAGAGAAGLSLAYYLSVDQTHELRIVLIDPDAKDQNDRTWCTWGAIPAPFDQLVSHQWQNLAFFDPELQRVGQLHPHPYRLLRGIDFYTFVKAQLRDDPRIHWHRAPVTALLPDPAGVTLHTATGPLRARYVYNSVPGLVDARIPMPTYALKQHFVGWEIETETPVFQPETAWLMDFRTPQAGCTRFFYLLPFSPHRALVEYTLFSETLLTPEAYEAALVTYIREQLGIARYHIRAVERGVIPMTDAVFRPAVGGRIFMLGTPAGAIKPTTGYGFTRIMREGQWLAQQALAGQPQPLPPRPYNRFSMYDQLLLYLLTDRGALGQRIFGQLFRHQPIPRILRFLDEQTSFGEEVFIFARLPIAPFLGAVWANLRYFFRRRLARRAYRAHHDPVSPAPLASHQHGPHRGDVGAPAPSWELAPPPVHPAHRPARGAPWRD